ncbi:MAG: SDR family oxidoreductase [Flavisolibacter sp.]
MQKALITGARGFVAHYLIKELLYHNYFVIGTGKDSTPFGINQANFIYEKMDFTNKEEVSEIINKYKPDIIIHCGAISKPDECELHKENAFLVNVTGTINLLQQAAKWQSFFIFLSTDFVFDGKKGMYKEDDERSSVNYYGETKILAEDEVCKYRYKWTIVRTVLVYGKSLNSRQNIVTMVASALRKGEKLNIFNDQIRTPTFVKDIAKGITTIVIKGVTGIYHISGKDILTPYEIAISVADYLHLDRSLINPVTEFSFSQPAKRPLKTGFNINKASDQLNYQPVSFEEGLFQTLEMP